ncbi:MAG TPA: hypothetical protein VEU98_00755 [Candidatus Eremiobacteraceae bacterium]|nr:hypothetical protein [Candidatus Eremiobacteraceae bacterium]
MKRTLRLAGLMILIAFTAGSLSAQDNPFVGTWKLNIAKSKFGSAQAPKSVTRTVVAQGDGAKYTFERVNADGTTSVYSFTAHYDGKDYPVSGTGMPGGADSIAGTRINSHRVESVLKKNGKQVGTSVSEVSADGKTTTIKAMGKNPDGSAYETESVYDKQ